MGEALIPLSFSEIIYAIYLIFAVYAVLIDMGRLAS